MRYKLTLSAEDDLERIWNYGADRFGEQQANIYYNGFFEAFEDISKYPLHHPIADQIGSDYRKCVYQSDTIYFRIQPDHVEITAIIGSQDAAAWME